MSESQRFAAFQHRDYRLLYFGRLPSVLGSQMQRIAITWHIFDLLRDRELEVEVFGRIFDLDTQALGLGGIGLASILPVFLFALLGGIVADSYDRRRILIIAQIVATLAAAVLTWLTFTDRITVPLLYGFTAITAAVFAFETPAIQALNPNLVPKKDFANAVSLNTILQYVGSITGPGIGAWLIANTTIGSVYLINTISFGSMIIGLLLIRHRSVLTGKNNFSLSALREGLQYTYDNKLVWSTMWIDFWATFFGSARSMLPIISERILGMGVEGFGLLATAQPVGAVITGLILATRKQIRKQGRVLLISVALYGLATALFGISTVFALSYIFFAGTGAADTVSSVIRGTIRQITTPDELRGRMTSVNMMFFMGGPQLGELEAGLVTALVNAPFAIVTGGLATIVMTGYMAWKHPKLRNYDQ